MAEMIQCDRCDYMEEKNMKRLWSRANRRQLKSLNLLHGQYGAYFRPGQQDYLLCPRCLSSLRNWFSSPEPANAGEH